MIRPTHPGEPWDCTSCLRESGDQRRVEVKSQPDFGCFAETSEGSQAERMKGVPWRGVKYSKKLEALRRESDRPVTRAGINREGS